MITPVQLKTIAASVSALPLNNDLTGQLRNQYPDIHFTYCMEDDIGNQQPALECAGFNLYLVDGREHCLCLTQNPDNATGIVIAEVIED